jgi:N-methylhydantoinase A
MNPGGGGPARGGRRESVVATVIGVDVGGTFTDVVLFDEDRGAFRVEKVPTTPNQADGFVRGLEQLGVPFSGIDLLVHGTTAGTNAILQRRGAACGLLTTAGFRDVLELRRRERPLPYGLTGDFVPLIERDRRLEIRERTDAAGTILAEPSEEEVVAAARQLLAQGVEAVAVAFLHAYRNPTNERRVREILERVWPNPYIALSSEILPQFGEFERTAATVVSAYVQPVVGRYFAALREALRARGFRKEVLVVQSNGGLLASPHATRYAASTVMSGPAAGVIAAAHLGRAAGWSHVIACDMGGTSFDVSLIVNGQPTYTTERQLEFGVPLALPMVDVISIGAGGGSIASTDGAGVLQVGPQSAGAVPGPACYGQGGQEPTVTDANLVLGRLGARFLGGDTTHRTLDPAAARAALEARLARPLGLSVEGAAEAVLRVANAKMSGAIRMISVARGFDPRDFVLLAFGGAGPLHAVELMREMGLAATVVPPRPGVTSALGCIIADVRQDFLQSVKARVADLKAEDVAAVLGEQVRRGRQFLEEQAIALEEVVFLHQADMAYEGQSHLVAVPLPSATPGLDEVRRQFEAVYTRQYGNVLEDHPDLIVNLRTAAIGRRRPLDLRALAPAGAGSLAAALREERPVAFAGRVRACPVYDRDRLPAATRLDGPAIIEQLDTTTVIPPDARLEVARWGNLVIRLR